MENGPYKHYERPEKGRASGKRPSSGKAWGFTISILIIILIALFPLTHHLATNNQEAKSQQPKEVQRVNKNSVKSKVKSSKKKIGKTNSSQLQKKNSKKQNPISKQSSQSSAKVKTYVVQSGDTLTSIAAKNNISVAQLAQLNGLDPNASIDAGQTIKLN